MPDIYNFFIGGSVQNLSMSQFFINLFSSLFFGVIVSLVYRFRNKPSQTMALTLVVLPAMVQVIIMLVSGNIGAGVAVAGAFSLVRFRSATGNARDIGYLFFAMVLGFITGMGLLLHAFLFMIIIGIVFLALAFFAENDDTSHVLRIVIPENLNFDGLFDEVFNNFVTSAELMRVKSTNMGSLYELKYIVMLKDEKNIKAFIDALRVRNGNLNIFLNRATDDDSGL